MRLRLVIEPRVSAGRAAEMRGDVKRTGLCSLKWTAIALPAVVTCSSRCAGPMLLICPVALVSEYGIR
jgi:hypothetical protein